MKISEQVCPVCKNKNEVEAIICWNCGTALDDPFMDPGIKTKTTDMPALVPEQIGDLPIDIRIDHAVLPDSGIAVYVEGEYSPAYIDSREEFVIGRKVGVTTEGLLDLSPLGAYHLGLSRRHAVVRRTESGYEVLDLGSANGTWLNNERLLPHKSYPMASGSHLRLGRMRLFVLYRPSAETQKKL